MNDFPQKNEQSGQLFIFSSEQELNLEAHKVKECLVPYVGENLAQEISAHILIGAKKIDETLKEVLSHDSVKLNYTYDGAAITANGQNDVTYVINGMQMLTDTVADHMQVFMGSIPSAPNPKDYINKVQNLLVYLGESYNARAADLKTRFEAKGRLHHSIADYQVKSVINPKSPNMEQEQLNDINDLSKQAAMNEAILRDPFFQKLEEEMKKPLDG